MITVDYSQPRIIAGVLLLCAAAKKKILIRLKILHSQTAVSTSLQNSGKMQAAKLDRKG